MMQEQERKRLMKIAKEVAAVYAKNAATYAEVNEIHLLVKELMVISSVVENPQ